MLAKKGRDGDGCHVPGLGDEWTMGFPKSPMWESEGDARSEDENASSATLVKATCAMMCCTSVDGICLVTRSIFSCRIWSWQKVALSCQMALEMLREELNGPWQPVRRCQKTIPFSRGWAVTQSERVVVREKKEKEREKRALLSWLSWPISFKCFVVRHDVVLERGFSFFSLCH